MVALLTAATLIGFLFRQIGLTETSIVMVYLLSVLLTAWLTSGVVFCILASVAATFLFNYFFTEPYFSFGIDDPGYLITFTVMTITALITSTLTSHAKRNERSAEEREAETKAVYNLTNRLTEAKDIHEIADIAVNAIGDSFGCMVACLCFDENGAPEKFFIQRISEGKTIRQTAENEDEIIRHVKEMRDGYYDGTDFFDLSVYGKESLLGMVRISKKNAEDILEAKKHLLRSMVESTALAMDRFRAAEQRAKSREEALQERYRGNLLRAISHDLRTPLTGILGASSAIIENEKSLNKATRIKLLTNIKEDSQWLIHMVENLLSVTRINQGTMKVTKTPEAVEEIVAAAANQIHKRFPDRKFSLKTPDELLVVPMDGTLIMQVLINLLENAIKHTPTGSKVSAEVRRENDTAVFEVVDNGNGISEQELPYLFEGYALGEKNSSDSSRGMGIGLSVCNSIIKAHDGKLEAANGKDGGAVFRFVLPLK
jgi:two-component system sensor histidine kinase KdpD